ncbi:hypothetical protein BH23GEM9_BH23GEM9_12820 [soil metagenome]
MKGVLAAVTAATLLACGSETSGPEMPSAATTVTMEDIVTLQTAWSGYESPARLLITSETQWAEAWARIYSNISPVPVRPAVDFSQNVIVLVAMGQRPTTGYSVNITETRVHGNSLYVRVTERLPGPSCGTGQALTAPVHAVQVPRQSGGAQFIVDRQTFSC